MTTMSSIQVDAPGMAGRLLLRDRFLLLTHRRPDGDTIGSAVALCRALRDAGKTAYILENRDLTVRYQPFFDGLTAPEGYSPETVVSTDVATTVLLPDNAQAFSERIDFAIDHHGSNSGFAAVNCVDAGSAACGELIFDIIKAMGVAVTREIADALYTAISTDTGCFRYSSTTARTHRICAELMDSGCDAAYLNFVLFEILTPAQVAVESAVLSTMQYFSGGAVAVAYVPHTLVETAGATEDDMESLSALARRIEGVRVGVTLYERKRGVKASVRTDTTIDASAICAKAGGGGHARAAGCMIYHSDYGHTITLDEAREILLRAVADTVTL